MTIDNHVGDMISIDGQADNFNNTYQSGCKQQFHSQSKSNSRHTLITFVPYNSGSQASEYIWIEGGKRDENDNRYMSKLKFRCKVF